MTRIALVVAYLIGVVAYLIGMVFAVLSMNEDPGGEWGEICLFISILLGAGTGDPRLAPLSVLAIPMTIPFGLPADETGDPVFPLWVGGMMFTFVSAALILFAAFGRQFVESRLRRWHAPGDST